jgi:hypothetical protein
MSTKVFNLQISEEHIDEARMMRLLGGSSMNDCPVARALIDAGYMDVLVTAGGSFASGIVFENSPRAREVFHQWDTYGSLEPTTVELSYWFNLSSG